MTCAAKAKNLCRISRGLGFVFLRRKAFLYVSQTYLMKHYLYASPRVSHTSSTLPLLPIYRRFHLINLERKHLPRINFGVISAIVFSPFAALKATRALTFTEYIFLLSIGSLWFGEFYTWSKNWGPLHFFSQPFFCSVFPNAKNFLNF